MTTQGKARLDSRGESLRSLPELIERAAAQGHPVIISWDIRLLGPMPEHTQRLYLTLGVPVRFV